MILETTLTIGTVVILAPLILKLGKLIQTKRYFASEDYKSHATALLKFDNALCEALGYKHPIQNTEQENLQRLGNDAASFFASPPFPLPEDITKAITHYASLTDQVNRHNLELELAKHFGDPFQALLASNQYITYRQTANCIAVAKKYRDELGNSDQAIFTDTCRIVANFDNAEHLVVQHNLDYVEKELIATDKFFSSCASYPLDRQQRVACITDEDAGLVIAGAGSGKTSVIMAKVAYLLKVKKIKPWEILLISFTKKAAEEMSARIEKCVPATKIAAMTFHKFGLEIIKKHTKGRYDIADDDCLRKFIHKAITGDATLTPQGYGNMVSFFAYHFNPDQSDKCYESLGEKIEQERSFDFETLRSKTYQAKERTTFAGERVKSMEEVLIANFLFLNKVNYVYEMAYTKHYEDTGHHRAYHPDFYLPDYDIYIEHFGVDQSENPPNWLPPIERQKYKDGMAWKRNLHRLHENKLIETFSWWNAEGKLLEKLKAELVKNGVAFNPREKKEVWQSLRENSRHQLNDFENLLAAFITHYKSNGYDKNHFAVLEKSATSNYDATRLHLFLKTAKEIFQLYQEMLANEQTYDFNDMILAATNIVEALAPNTLPYKYVIVDEYQDASMSRMKLLKAVIGNTNAHLLCVGDDWQSIFRFTGSDINLFTKFGEYFGRFADMKIETTYRNSQDLIDVMNAFVLKNQSQLKKNLKSAKRCAYPIVPIVFGKDGKRGQGISTALQKAISSIAALAKGKKCSILLLGRTNHDINAITSGTILCKTDVKDTFLSPQHPNLAFKFLTVHKSKGLEGDYVILLNALNHQLGFPNKIVDDPILQLVLSSPESFEYAEERRLFYVALTRTRNKVYILTPSENHSKFMDDLYAIGVEKHLFVNNGNNSHAVRCPKCGRGILVTKTGPSGQFSGCSNYPKCDYAVNMVVDENTPRCKRCGGFMVLRLNKTTNTTFYGCTNYPLCTNTQPSTSKYPQNNLSITT